MMELTVSNFSMVFLVFMIAFTVAFLLPCDKIAWWPCNNETNTKEHKRVEGQKVPLVTTDTADCGSAVNASPFDIWSLTHLCHGVLLAYVVNILNLSFLKTLWTPLAWGLLWEVLENTNTRATAGDLEYAGDSRVNSLGDIFCAFIGFAATQTCIDSDNNLLILVPFLFVVATELLLKIVLNYNMTEIVLSLLIRFKIHPSSHLNCSDSVAKEDEL